VNGSGFDGEHARAIEALDRLLRRHPQDIEADAVQATRALVSLRNRLIGLRRSAHREELGATLAQVNSALSELMGGHYPVAGIRWDCMKQARNALAGLTTIPDDGAAARGAA
jgi:hypothetical protein